MIKLSVIIPVYNVEKYIYECIESLINQSIKEIEIIVIDDGSKDSSIEIVKSSMIRESILLRKQMVEYHLQEIKV